MKENPTIAKRNGRASSPYLWLVPVLLAVLAAYAGGVTNGFVWDDQNFITNNGAMKDVSNPLKFFYDNTKFCQIEYYQYSIYRPLRTALFWGIYKLFGENPVPFHLFSLLVHIANVALVFMLLSRLKTGRVVPFAVSLLFGLHPALSEAVYSINYLSDPLFTLFALLFAWRLFFFPGGTKNLLILLLFFVLALFSKESALALFLIAVFHHCFIKNRDERKSAGLLPVLSLFAVSAVYFFARSHLTGRISQLKMTFTGVLENLLVAPILFFKYLGLLIFPAGLSTFYEVKPADYGWPAVAVAMVAAVTVLFLPLVFRKRFPVASIFLFWLIAGLLPVMNILPVSTSMAERFLYFPSIGFLAFAIIGLKELTLKISALSIVTLKRVSVCLILAMAVLFIVETHSRAKVWRSDENIFKDALGNYPRSGLVNINLGWTYYLDGETDRAVPYIEDGIKYGQNASINYETLARIFVDKRDAGEGISVSRRCLEIYPASYGCTKTLAYALGISGTPSDAYPLYESLIGKDPLDPEVFRERSYLNFRSKKFKAALADSERALELQPLDREALFLRELLCKKIGGKDCMAGVDAADGITPKQAESYKEKVCRKIYGKEAKFCF